MTEYSSPYKVGLINVGTTFAQSRLVWSGITYGRLNFRCTVILVRRFVASANLAPHKSAQVIIHCGTRYVDFLSLLGDLIFDSVHPLYPAFDSTCDSASKNVKAWYRRWFDSKPPNIPAYRPGDPGVFHSRCQGLWTHVSLLGLANPDAELL